MEPTDEAKLSAADKAAARKARKDQLKQEKEARKQKGKETPKKEVKPVGQGKRAKDIRLKTEFVNTTPKGEKKDMSQPMADSYNPPAVEAAWYDWWVAKGFFSPDSPGADPEKRFVMVIPPPNVTGALHMGHALTNSIEDAVTRWNRMRGYTALWVPGTDHAGIATQTVVEKKLAREHKQTRHDLGREKFIELVQEWKDEYQSRILSQLQRLGSSLDWSRCAFTMDPNFSKAVIEAFIRLHDEGLIYRDNRLVNWCCALQSTISDLEVDYVELPGKKKLKVPGYDKLIDFGEIVKFAYKVVDSDEEIIVATTRVETMLGDVAVAIRGDDARYTHLHGKQLYHPFRKESIPIIIDNVLVIEGFGTGAVKVTPAHDPEDYKCGKRNNLPTINILNDDGTFNEFAGKYQGKRRYDVRYEILGELDQLGLLRGRESHPMRLATCSRTGDIIEPTLKPQWWMNCEEMAQDALESIRTEEIRLIPPEPHTGTWNHYLKNIQPWCISRQLWWGHRIPAYRISLKGNLLEDSTDSWVSGRSEEEARARAIEKFAKDGISSEDIQLHQDEDVLDTWFSSGLFPIGVFGWPDNTVDLQRFYPTSLLETGKDILFFWVMRMVMMCKKLTGQNPFSVVFLHSIVRDAHGRKMSKSLGNVIDPVAVIEGITLDELHETLRGGNLAEDEIQKAIQGQKRDFPKGISECGTDAMRFSLCSYTSQGTDINLDINKVVTHRNFCNKLWNAVKFALLNLGDFSPRPKVELTGRESLPELWILSCLARTIKIANDGWQSYEFGKATDVLYVFWYDQLCSVFFEVSKGLFSGAQGEELESLRNTLYNCVEVGLRLLHPFMPFVSEELWQRLPRREGDYESIMISPYPSGFSEFLNDQIENDFTQVQELGYRLRAVRASYSVPPKTLTQVFVRVGDAATREFIEKYSHSIKVLSFAKSLELTEENLIHGYSVEIINPNLTAYTLLEGIINFAQETQKLEKTLAALEKSLIDLTTRIQSPLYANVPEPQRVVDQQKLEEFKHKIEATKTTLEHLATMQK